VSKLGLLLAVPVPGGDIVVGNWIRCAVAGEDDSSTSIINRKNGNRTIRDTILLPFFGRFVPIYKREKMEPHPTGIRRFLQGKDLIQLGTFSIPNPDGGVKSNYRVISGPYIAQNPPFAASDII
jgi:hypothetical protein